MLKREFGPFRHTVHLYLTDVCPDSPEIWQKWWTSRTIGATKGVWGTGIRTYAISLPR